LYLILLHFKKKKHEGVSEEPLPKVFTHQKMEHSWLFSLPANFPDSGGISPISTILPDFPIGIFKILYFPDFLSLSPVLRQSTTYFQPKSKIPCHLVTPANQNQDKQSPLLHVYLMQRVETIWII
jgi:hypothetical protein